MKKLLPIIAFCFFILSSNAQTVLYNQDFDGVSAPDLPAGWWATSDQIFTNNSSASSGYPGASGGNNLLSRNCIPNGEVRSFQVDGISSLGFEELTVSFGHRRTNSFTPPVALEWSSDGASWNVITYNSGSAGTAWALFTSEELPSGAENQASLSFRWTYTTNVNSQCDNFAGNYRIDDFTVRAETVLPIELLEFSCFQEKKSVQLNWRTATEISSDFFAVERSANNRDFSELERIAGAGTSFEPREYTFTDDNPMPGLNYYRLRQVDFDGRFSYSRVVTVQIGQSGGIRVFPSPASAILNVQLEQPAEEPAVWEIFDLTGRFVATGLFSSESVDLEIDVADLPDGVYLLRVVAGREATVRQFQKVAERY